ncbi:hypothetical protein J422_04468 [Methanocaldococcus villosus KIN24-T80]|uniref:DUF4352 domain-containing protein n=1 Tax=Methanocaldococcus villosus KIN24-T80 TaxID=1069083 RepID=N6V1F5_9EURY|nr:DUF4352 domain-containing protein [Methanocaldococcus villosus]ENN96093.1 hypothetical protein J422_04468 [Methanocaldococcus villosus KIN24-T80]
MDIKTLIFSILILIIVMFSGMQILDFVKKSFYDGEFSINNSKEVIVKLKIGEFANNSKVNITVEDVMIVDTLKGNMGYRKIKNNETFVIVKIKAKNLQDKKPYQISNMDFTLLDENGKSYDAEMNVLDIKNALVIEAIPPKKSYEGYIIYKVPKDIKVIKIEYDFKNLNNLFDNYKAIWEVNVSDIPHLKYLSLS